MKYFVNFVFLLIFIPLRIIGAIFIILWHFKLNPILEEGTRDGYYYKPYDYKLKDWLIYGVKPEHRQNNNLKQ